MNGPLAVIAAGSTFAITVILGLAAGIWLDHRLGTDYWVIVLFGAGVVIGGVAAWRLVAGVSRPS